MLGFGLLVHGLVSADTLFDGESLQGWHIMQRPSDDNYYATGENFYVEDGAIVCAQTDSQKGGLLLTDATFVDFELELDFKSDWGCDSGVFLRCTESGQGIQILNDYLEGGNVGGIFGQGTGEYVSRPIQLRADGSANRVVAHDVYDGAKVDGLVFFIDAAGWNQLWKPGQWNTLKVRCIGAEPRITTWLNGVKVMEMDGRVYQGRHLMDESVQNWSAPPAWDREQVQSITGNAGQIGLQIHPGDRWKPGGRVQYRNIRLTSVQ